MEELEPREGVNWQEHFPQLTEQGVQTSSSFLPHTVSWICDICAFCRGRSTREDVIISSRATHFGPYFGFLVPFTLRTPRETLGW